MVRKYIVGTRSRHRKIASIAIDEEVEGPDEQGIWTMHGGYATQDGSKEQFAASVTSKGEVRITIVRSDDATLRRPSTSRRR